MSEVKEQAARKTQSEKDREKIRNLFLNKKPRSITRDIELAGERVTVTFTAISNRELDDLRSKHKPTDDQRREGLGINEKTFAPALIHATWSDDLFSLDEIVALRDSENFSSGEFGTLYGLASEVCVTGLLIPSSATA